MTIKNTGERKVRPTHPGEMLREDFLPDYDLNVSSFAKALGVSRQTVNELVCERRSVILGWHFEFLACLVILQSSGSTLNGP